MRNRMKRVLVGLSVVSQSMACSSAQHEEDTAASGLASLMDDGAATVSLGSAPSDSVVTRYCTDCSSTPLAFWKFDFCHSDSTDLEDSATSTPTLHPAFRAVSVDCVAGREGQAVQLAGGDDIVYSPDQPDYDFSQGLTIALWIKPDSVARTQSLVRKRLDGSSAFVLAIDDGRLKFVLRRISRRLVGIAAPIEAGRFTHVAATYDGQQMRLYLGGALAAETTAVGETAPGAGPIYIGNDASGRQFTGVVDEVWVNTLAAPPETVKGLNCVRLPPVLDITPSESQATNPNSPVAFDVNVTNPSDPTFCPSATYLLVPNLPYPLSVDNWSAELAVAPGETAKLTAIISATTGGSPGPITFYYSAYDQANYSLSANASATFVVAAGG